MEKVRAYSFIILFAVTLASPVQNEQGPQKFNRDTWTVFRIGVPGAEANKWRMEGKTSDVEMKKVQTSPNPATGGSSLPISEDDRGVTLGNRRHSTALSSKVEGNSMNAPVRVSPRATGVLSSWRVDVATDGDAHESHPQRSAPRRAADSGRFPTESPPGFRGRSRRGRRAARRTHPPSPCPGLFSYLREGPRDGKWYGIVHLTAKETVVGVRLDIQLDKPAILLGAWLGDVKTINNKDFTIWNREKTIHPSAPLPVKILVQYDENALPPPRVKKIMFNGIQICPKKEGESGTLTRHSLPGQLNIKRDSNTKPPSFNFGNQETADDEIVDGVPCGRIAPRPTLLISHGKPTERGDWPWHAAIYKSEKNDLIYICGGSIIRRRMVLTAAHCVTEVVGRITKNVATDSLVVFLGKYFLKGWEEGIQTKEVEEIHVNSEYSATNYNADIAILVLSTPMDFTDYVRPVCLWNGNRPHLSEIEGLDGVVVGWGYDEASKITERLMMANMPVVPTQECLWSNPEFFSRYASDRTFCAGYKNGTTACNGDSGGGMFFPKKEPGKGNKLVSPLTWTLRGIVSLSVSLENRPICDPKYHVVFTDAAKFYHWIKQYH